jgi:hypothetical protein
MVYRVKDEVTTFVRLLTVHNRLHCLYKDLTYFVNYCISAC